MTEFHFERWKHPRLGELLAPMIPVRVSGPRRTILLSMCLDSGADISLVPFSVGRALGLQLDMATLTEVRGISQVTIPYVLAPVDVRIGAMQAEVRIAWSLSEDVPAILGRLDVFRRFAIEFREFEDRILVKLPNE